MKNRNLLLPLIALGLTLSFVTPVAAETTTKRECTTDSYGNVTCHDVTTNTETGEITYSNESVTRVTDTISYQDQVSRSEILNAGLPGWVNVAASTVVILGVFSLILKRFI